MASFRAIRLALLVDALAAHPGRERGSEGGGRQADPCRGVLSMTSRSARKTAGLGRRASRADVSVWQRWAKMPALSGSMAATGTSGSQRWRFGSSFRDVLDQASRWHAQVCVPGLEGRPIMPSLNTDRIRDT